jgi:hypothetical protein
MLSFERVGTMKPSVSVLGRSAVHSMWRERIARYASEMPSIFTTSALRSTLSLRIVFARLSSFFGFVYSISEDGFIA